MSCGVGQTWLGSSVAVAMAVAGSFSSNLTPTLATSICCRWGPKKQKKKKKKETKKKKSTHSGSSLVVYCVKEPALLLQWLGFDP